MVTKIKIKIGNKKMILINKIIIKNINNTIIRIMHFNKEIIIKMIVVLNNKK